MQLSAYRGLDNNEEIEFNEEGGPYNFDNAGVTSAFVLVNDQKIPAEVTGANRNIISFKPGLLNLLPGVYDAFIVVISAQFPAGQIIAGPGTAVALSIKLYR